MLRGGVFVRSPDDLVRIVWALPHGHAAAVLGTMRGLGLDRILGRRKSRMRGLAMAARPTALQKRAFELLEIRPPGNVVSSVTG